MAYDVLVFYAALLVWVATLVYGIRQRRFWPFAVFGMFLMAALNIRYFIEGPPAAIAFFVGIYDVFDNIGLAANEGAPALAPCVDNACTVWGDRYLHHPSWGVAFYDRFASGPALRTNLLYGHIFFNSIAFVLMHVQLARPGTGPDGPRIGSSAACRSPPSPWAPSAPHGWRRSMGPSTSTERARRSWASTPCRPSSTALRLSAWSPPAEATSTDTDGG